jgi:hypothetical protein
MRISVGFEVLIEILPSKEDKCVVVLFGRIKG